MNLTLEKEENFIIELLKNFNKVIEQYKDN